jgi:BASS family bile acid:Na+ symporter
MSVAQTVQMSWIIALALIAVAGHAFRLGSQAGRPYMHRLFKRPAVLMRFFVATFVIMPALALLIARVAGPTPLWAGLALISITPPGIGVSGRVLKLKGDAQVGLAWEALAVLISVVTIPLSVWLVGRLFNLDLDLGLVPLLKRVVVLFALPLLAGLALRQLAPGATGPIDKVLKPVLNGATLILLGLILIRAAPQLIAQGALVLAAVFAFVISAIAVGHWMGGPPDELRPTLASVLATRWIAPAVAIAQANNSVDRILPVLIAYVIAATALMPLYGWLLSRRPPQVPLSAPHR